MSLQSILSDSFFGCKKFLPASYQTLTQTHTLTPQQTLQLFPTYCSILSQCSTSSSSLPTTLLDIFSQFLQTNALKFINWPYQKLSTWIQISAHVFEYSFDKHLSKKQSFEYFSQLIVRHSLFRPPHCVHVFDYQEAKLLTDFWIDTFVRFYQQYRMCFQVEVNQVLEVVAPGLAPLQDLTTTKKEISREDFKAKFGQIIQINDAVKKGA